jgi:hypothetical protein
MSKEALKLVSIKVMENWAKEYLKIWVAYGPFTIVEKSVEKITLKNKDGRTVSFDNPHLEDWTLFDGPGKALAALVKDPGMHNSAMWVYSSGHLCQLVTYNLSDCCGNPTALGEEVCKALSK